MAEQLTDYAVTTRYPEYFREMSMDEAKSAIQAAAGTRIFVRKKLGMEDFSE